MSGRTVTVRDVSGYESELDIPDEGTQAHELWLDHLRTGRYVLVDDEAQQPTAPVDPDAVPDASIGDVIDWIRQDDAEGEPSEGWVERAGQALDAELAKGDDARVTLVKSLSEVLADLPVSPVEG